jgi:citrate lyase beta subunit
VNGASGGRLRAARSVLVCPATNRRMVEKAVASAADLALLDLEDAVAPAEKAAGRAAVAAAFRDLAWGTKPRAVRVNAVSTPWCWRDLTEVVAGSPGLLDLVVVPKVDDPADVAFVDRLLAQLEADLGIAVPIALHVQIETVRGVAECRAIARASPRIAALVFGPGDYAASLGAPLAAIGTGDAHDAAYPGHRWGYAMHEILVAARAVGALALDGPVADFRDPDALRRSAAAARALGYDGKWCIHPAQVEPCNAEFSPSTDEVAAARALVAAYADAAASGRGALTHDGVMIDAASVRMAQSVLARTGAPQEATPSSG